MLPFEYRINLSGFWIPQNVHYSYHLNMKHLKSKHLTFQTLFCPDHMIRQTIPKPDIFDLETDISVWFSDHHSKTRHLATKHVRTIWLVRYSNGYCNWMFSSIGIVAVLGEWHTSQKEGSKKIVFYIKIVCCPLFHN